jgi:hypothetical protein
MSLAAKQTPPLAPRIAALLAGLRWRIRLYTFLEGLALVIAWLALMFWIALALDFLPVRLGASEMPVAARAVLLGVMGLGAAYVLYRWVLRRTFAPMADHSMAVLLERQNASFHDSLLTAVEMHERPDHAQQFNWQMLQHAGDEALAHAPDVRLNRVFRWAPLARGLGLAALLGGSVVLFAIFTRDTGAFAKATDRIYLLADEPWERLAHLEVLGVTTYRIDHVAAAAGADASSLADNRPKLAPITREFVAAEKGETPTVRIARGSSPKLTIRADVVRHTAPGSVTLWWRTVGEDGVAKETGTARMSAGSESSEGFLPYTFARPPLKDIVDSVEIEARGYDFRTPRYRIEVVDAPAITKVDLVYERPDYLVDEARSMFKTVKAPLIAGSQLPRGSRVTIVAHVNKPLRSVYVYDVEAKATRVLDVKHDPQSEHHEVRYVVDSLTRNVMLEWMLVDTDDLVTETPHLVAFGVKEDEPPQVKLALRGIGSAVTAEARIPFAGRITDDYWLERAWLQMQVGEATPRTLPLPIERGGFDAKQAALIGLVEGDNVFHAFDLRDERNRSNLPLELKAGDKLTLTIQAADRFNLDGFSLEANPRTGLGDKIELDVVTPDELLSLLERRELELRRRLEQAVEELTQMRDSLVRVKTDVSGQKPDTAEPGDTAAAETDPAIDPAEPGDEKLTPEEAAGRAVALRRLWVQRAVNQSEKSRGETQGVGIALLDVVAQLENNRVDTEDRQERLREQVAGPLLAVVKDDFPKLDVRLAALNTEVAKSALDRTAAASAADQAIAQADGVLLGLDSVLKKMLDLESFNELIDLVRALLEEQDDVIKETKVLRNQEFGLE